MSKCCFLAAASVVLLLVDFGIMNESVNSVGGERLGENWAVVPYESKQNALFPAFNEKTRKFKFRNIKKEIVIAQNWDGQGVSAVVWEAAIELTNYLAKNEELKGKKILELGSGTGLVGIVCASLGAKVTVTDLKEALPFLARNVDLNFAADDEAAPEVNELKWGENLSRFHPRHFDIIVGADVIYIEETFDDLLDTICYLAGYSGSEASYHDTDTESDIKPIVLLSSKMRYLREKNFMNQMKKFFNVDLTFENTNTNIHIYKAVPF